MKRFGLYLALVFIALMVLAPLFTLKGSLSAGKLQDQEVRLHWNTGNTTRIWAEDWDALQAEVLSTRFALKNPSFVVLVPSDSWKEVIAGLSLTAGPVGAALVLVRPEAGMGEETEERLDDLVGPGLPDGMQVLLLGRAAVLREEVEALGCRAFVINEGHRTGG